MAAAGVRFLQKPRIHGAMALFEIDLKPVEDIAPWGTGDNQSLSWFALSEGRLRINAGDEELFRHSSEILAHWGKPAPDKGYFLAELARDVLKSVATGILPLPPHIERIAASWEVLMRLRERSKVREDKGDHGAYEQYNKAWGWLEDRSPWTSYAATMPQIHFIRFGLDIRIYWDNRDYKVDGIGVWAAQKGSASLALDAFLGEWRDFAERLLNAMGERIRLIADGTIKPQIPVDLDTLQKEHDQWCEELRRQLHTQPREEEEEEAAVSWKVAGDALKAIVDEQGG